MKKAIYLLVLLFSFTFIVGCDSNETEEPTINNNEQIYNNFKDEFNKYQLDIAVADKLVSEVSVSYTILSLSDKELGKAKSDSVIKICKSPFYIEATTNVNYEDNKKFIYTFENNKYYQNEIIDDTNIVTSYIDDFDNLDIEDSDEIVDFSFNYDKGTAEYKDGEYTFIQNYKDAIDMKEHEYLEDLYKEFGILLSSVLSSNVETKFKFENEQLFMSFEFDLEVVIDSYVYKMNALISYRFKVEDFEMMDISNHQKIFVDLWDINEYSKLDVFYKNDFNYHNRCMKYKLNKGYYYFKSSADTNYFFDFEILDANQCVVEVNKLIDFNDQFELGTVFEIEKDGDYYIQFRYNYQPICLSEFDINNYKEVDIVLGEDTDLNIGENGYVNININQKDLGHLIIENKGDHPIKYFNDLSIQVKEIMPGEFIIMRNNPRRKIILIGDSNSSNTKINVSFQAYQGTQPIENLEELTLEPSPNLMIAEMAMIDKQYKLVITEEGYYKLNCVFKGVDIPVSFLIQNSDNESLFNDGTNTWLLTPGTYVVTPLNHSKDYVYGYVSYSKVEVE